MPPHCNTYLYSYKSWTSTEVCCECYIHCFHYSGHTTILSLHYKTILEKFSHVPALVVTGARNTGKTQSTEMSSSFLGKNSGSICVVKDVTLASLRERYTEDHFPLIIHDCKDNALVATAIQECFEGKKVTNHNSSFVPGTTLAITCNESQMNYLQSR